MNNIYIQWICNGIYIWKNFFSPNKIFFSKSQSMSLNELGMIKNYIMHLKHNDIKQNRAGIIFNHKSLPFILIILLIMTDIRSVEQRCFIVYDTCNTLRSSKSTILCILQ